MATRRYNGHKHHSRKHQSSEHMNRRRLSKQEEIDLTADTIDINDKCNNYINCEPTLAPAIHVNSVDDRTGLKSNTETDRTDCKQPIDLNDNCNPTTLQIDSELEKSFADKLNVNESNVLTTEDIKEKKRGKHLARAEAVRDTSASPPPTQISDSEEKSWNTLSVNSQSQTGYSVNSSQKSKYKSEESNGSLDRSSPCLSRDSSTENYSDLNGTDVQLFLTETLQKNKKDRVFLLKIEQELNALVKDNQKTTHKFGQMTSYNRMLVHRVAALFGFEHNVDVLGTSVVVNKCKNTRIPDLKFKDCIKEDSLSEPKKSILKRDSASLEDGSNCSSVSFDGKEKSPDRQNGNICDSTRSKSFEEREERYEKARARIFNQDSSSSTEGNDNNSHSMSEPNSCNNLIQRNSSLGVDSQSNEDLAAKPNNSSEVRNWSSTDSSDSSGLQRSDSKSNQLKANCVDSEPTPKPTPLSTSASCGQMSLLAPNPPVSVNNGCTQPKSRPTVTKASSFGGISRNVNNGSNSTQTHLSKSGSFNACQNSSQGQSGAIAISSNRATTPKNSFRQEVAHKPVANNSTSHSTEQRYVSSQQTHQSVHSSTASHHNRHQNWHQNSHPRNNNRETSYPNPVQWHQPHFIFQPQNDSNLNQMKDSHYLQSGQHLYLSSVPQYGHTLSNEPPQHMTPIRLIYPNQPQMRPNQMMNSSVAHQNVSNQMSSVPFPLQPNPSALNFSGNQSNIQNNPMMSGSLSHSYGAPLQLPSNVGNVGAVWIIGNGVNPQSTSPLMTCPPPPNTPPSATISSNIAPYVGMSYQQYRPPHNSNASLNPNLSVNAAQNRGTAPLLKSQPLLATQANNQRILTSNGNHYVQQPVPDMADMNLMGANNFMNRAAVAPQMSHLRRMPANSNQGLDVRLMGPQSSPPFLLPTPQRPYFPMSNSVTVNQRSFYANNANNVNQRSKHSFSKNKSQNNRYNNNANNRNTNTNCSNT